MTLSIAQFIINEALKAAALFNATVNVAVVDSGGNLVSFMRMDDALLGSVDVAVKKAKTAVLYDVPTFHLDYVIKNFVDTGIVPGSLGHDMGNGGLITLPGGFPIYNSNSRTRKMIGGLGVCGTRSEKDLVIALVACKEYILGKK